MPGKAEASAADKENRQPESANESWTPGKRKAEELEPAAGSKVPRALAADSRGPKDSTSQLPPVGTVSYIELTVMSNKIVKEPAAQTVPAARSAHSPTSAVNLLSSGMELLNVSTVSTGRTEFDGLDRRSKKSNSLALQLPPTPGEPEQPSASSLGDEWSFGASSGTEDVYPTPSPTYSPRELFFGSNRVEASGWYRIRGSEEDGEPSVDDLDRAQDPDPLHLREYAEEIHRYLKDLELKSKVKRDYLDTQPFITWEMRNDLIDWLMDVAQHLRFHAETVHHTCVLLDLYLSTSTRHVDPIHFQLLGTACFLLAAKVEEIEPPTLSWLVACGDGAFDRESLKIAEINVLDTLGWNVGGFTNISHFLARACRAEALGKTKHIAAYIVELALFERKLLGENPSLVCAAAVWIARKVAGKKACWTPSLEYHLDQSPASAPFHHCVRVLFDRLRQGSPSQTLLLRHPGTWLVVQKWAKVVPHAELERMLRSSAAKFAVEPPSPSPTPVVSSRSGGLMARSMALPPPPKLRLNFLSFP